MRHTSTFDAEMCNAFSWFCEHNPSRLKKSRVLTGTPLKSILWAGKYWHTPHFCQVALRFHKLSPRFCWEFDHQATAAQPSCCMNTNSLGLRIKAVMGPWFGPWQWYFQENSSDSQAFHWHLSILYIHIWNIYLIICMCVYCATIPSWRSYWLHSISKPWGPEGGNSRKGGSKSGHLDPPLLRLDRLIHLEST